MKVSAVLVMPSCLCDLLSTVRPSQVPEKASLFPQNAALVTGRDFPFLQTCFLCPLPLRNLPCTPVLLRASGFLPLPIGCATLDFIMPLTWTFLSPALNLVPAAVHCLFTSLFLSKLITLSPAYSEYNTVA